MTPVEARCYRAIRDLTIDGVPPSFTELRDNLGLKSTGHTHGLVMSLARQGKVTYDQGRARSLRLTAGPYERASVVGLTSAQLGDLRDLCLSILAKRLERGE